MPPVPAPYSPNGGHAGVQGWDGQFTGNGPAMGTDRDLIPPAGDRSLSSPRPRSGPRSLELPEDGAGDKARITPQNELQSVNEGIKPMRDPLPGAPISSPKAPRDTSLSARAPTSPSKMHTWSPQGRSCTLPRGISGALSLFRPSTYVPSGSHRALF